MQDPSNNGENFIPLQKMAYVSKQDKGYSGSQIKHNVSCQKVITLRVPPILEFDIEDAVLK